MQSTVETYHLQDFIEELSAFSMSDILVHIPENTKTVYTLDEFRTDFRLPSNALLNQLYKVAVQYKKVSDIQSLCIAKTCLDWEVKGRKVVTPLFLFPLHCNYSKVKSEFSFQVMEQDVILNPFIVHYLKHEFELELDVPDEDWPIKQDILLHFLREKGFVFDVLNNALLGNFHYHRFELLKDLESIQAEDTFPPLLHQLLGNTTEQRQQKLSANFAFEHDTDQDAAFELFQQENVVVQGPPGTGKSHLLANVLVKLLHKKSFQAVISEKRTALEVLNNKLKEKGLHHFVALIHAQSTASDFIKHLKSSWHFLESYEKEPSSTRAFVFEDKLKQVQQGFDKLISQEITHHFSLSELQGFLNDERFKHLPLISKLPNYGAWLKDKITCETLFNSLKKNTVLALVKQSSFQAHSRLDDLFELCFSKWNTLKKEVSFKNINDLRSKNKQALMLQLLQNENASQFKAIYVNKKNERLFLKLKSAYEKINIQFEAAESEIALWNRFPSKSQLESWQKNLKGASWFSKRKVVKEIKKALQNPTLDLEIALNNALNIATLLEEKTQLQIALLGLGVDAPEHQLKTISFVLNELKKYDDSPLKESVFEINEEQTKILEHASSIRSLLRDIESYFLFDETRALEEQFFEVQNELEQLLIHASTLKQLNPTLYAAFASVKNVQELEACILKNESIRLFELFPDLQQFNGEKLCQTLDSILEEEQNYFEHTVENIHLSKLNQFQDFHQLLQTPSAKLSAEKKALKQELKNGKSILVKEFAKSRSHKSLRELLHSDAKHWIQLLNPLFLFTGNAISKHIPLEKEFFDCVIFDEASQIPLAKALPCLYRGKQTLVAGDSQQMPPSSLFSGMKSGVDLLHQATFYLKQVPLKHHYRSIYPELIAFSNKHFYDNELIVYPSSKEEKQAVQWHFCENGRYDERQNPTEAKQVANLLCQLLSENKSIGVVAFSEQQLLNIQKQISPEYLHEVERRLAKNTLFFKALEQVQGEECDILLISMAYGKNKENVFHLRFGPLNQYHGIKRLNVLLTRAKEKIHFFSSVKADDFSVSANEAVNLLRLYLLDLQQGEKEQQLTFPYDISPKVQGKKLFIDNIQRQIPNVRELKTFHAVMKQRGWNLNYQL